MRQDPRFVSCLFVLFCLSSFIGTVHASCTYPSFDACNADPACSWNWGGSPPGCTTVVCSSYTGQPSNGCNYDYPDTCVWDDQTETCLRVPRVAVRPDWNFFPATPPSTVAQVGGVLNYTFDVEFYDNFAGETLSVYFVADGSTVPLATLNATSPASSSIQPVVVSVPVTGANVSNGVFRAPLVLFSVHEQPSSGSALDWSAASVALGTYPVTACSNYTDYVGCGNNNYCTWTGNTCTSVSYTYCHWNTNPIDCASDSLCLWKDNTCFTAPLCRFITDKNPSDCATSASYNHLQCAWVYPSTSTSCKDTTTPCTSLTSQQTCNAAFNGDACIWTPTSNICQPMLPSQLTVIRQDPTRFPANKPGYVVRAGDVLTYWVTIQVFSPYLTAGGSVNVSFSINAGFLAFFNRSSVAAGSSFPFSLNVVVPTQTFDVFDPGHLYSAVVEKNSTGVVLANYNTNELDGLWYNYAIDCVQSVSNSSCNCTTNTLTQTAVTTQSPNIHGNACLYPASRTLACSCDGGSSSSSSSSTGGDAPSSSSSSSSGYVLSSSSSTGAGGNTSASFNCSAIPSGEGCGLMSNDCVWTNGACHSSVLFCDSFTSTGSGACTSVFCSWNGAACVPSGNTGTCGSANSDYQLCMYSSVVRAGTGGCQFSSMATLSCYNGGCSTWNGNSADCIVNLGSGSCSYNDTTNLCLQLQPDGSTATCASYDEFACYEHLNECHVDPTTKVCTEGANNTCSAVLNPFACPNVHIAGSGPCDVDSQGSCVVVSVSSSSSSSSSSTGVSFSSSSSSSTGSVPLACDQFTDYANCTTSAVPGGCKWTSWTPGWQPSACVAGSCASISSFSVCSHNNAACAWSNPVCSQRPPLTGLQWGAPFVIAFSSSLVNPPANGAALNVTGQDEQLLLTFHNNGAIPIQLVDATMDGVPFSCGSPDAVLLPVSDGFNALFCTSPTFVITTQDAQRGNRTLAFVLDWVDTSNYSHVATVVQNMVLAVQPLPPAPLPPAYATSDPGTPTQVVTLVFATPLQILDKQVFSQQVCSEVTSLTSTTTCTVLSVQPQSVQTRLLLTAAQALQQFLLAGNQAQLNSTTFPVFANTQQLLPTGPVDPSLPTQSTYDLTCNQGLNCNLSSTEELQCVQGVCSCVTDAEGFCVDNPLCVGGAVSFFPDVCLGGGTTPDELVYGTTTCADHHPSFINLFPLRRYCVPIDKSLYVDRALITGMFGSPDVAPPVLLFTIHSPYTIPELLSNFRDPVTGLICFEAYVSNLYDDLPPVLNKAWSRICTASFVGNHTLQLTELRFLDSQEGDANYYYHNDRWHAMDPPVPHRAYAYWNSSSNSTAWACQTFTAYNPYTEQCEPGCTNGYTGVYCDTPIDAPTCALEPGVPFSNTTAYIDPACNLICIPGYMPTYPGGCVSMEGLIPYVPELENPGLPPPPAPLDLHTLLLAGLITVSAVVVLVVLWYTVHFLLRQLGRASSKNPHRVHPR